MTFLTTDLCDKFGRAIQVAEPVFHSYGAVRRFHGELVTIRVPDDFLLVKNTLAKQGNGKVLVVDGGGALNYALMGDRLAMMAVNNNWSGVIVNGCIRDSVVIETLEIGVMALATCPARPSMEGAGDSGVPVHFAGVNFSPGHFVYVDQDGMVVSSAPLSI